MISTKCDSAEICSLGHSSVCHFPNVIVEQSSMGQSFYSDKGHTSKDLSSLSQVNTSDLCSGINEVKAVASSQLTSQDSVEDIEYSSHYSVDYSDNSSQSSSSHTKACRKNFQKRESLTFSFRKKKRASDQHRKVNRWSLARLVPSLMRKGRQHGLPDTRPAVDDGSCICTAYRRTEEHVLGPGLVFSASRKSDNLQMPVPPPLSQQQITHQQHQSTQQPAPERQDSFHMEDIDALLLAERARDIEEGIEISASQLTRNARTQSHGYKMVHASISVEDPVEQQWPTIQRVSAVVAAASNDIDWSLSTKLLNNCAIRNEAPIHTQVDYIHCLVPDIEQVSACSFYWGIMDRYEAERLLDGKQEGTFLLRDSAQEEFLFSVSFRRYGRSLHARVEQWNHRFSFDSHDPGVFSSSTVCGLVKHYNDPSCCMFFEPMLTVPLHRNSAFSLQQLCRAVVSAHTSYNGINTLPLPASLREYLKYYHYKQKVRVRTFDTAR